MDHNSYHYINQDYNRYRNDYGSMYNGNENYNINYPNLMPYQNDQPQPAPARQRIRENPPMKSPSIFVYPENVPNALSLIEQALGGETEDRIFYGFLIENAPSEEDARIIDSIRQDEIKHYGLFRQIYYELTGEMTPESNEEEVEQPQSYCDGLKHALLGEQSAVSRYRQILYAMRSRIHINMLTEIMTDEIRHGLLYNYLYSKNGCNV